MADMKCDECKGFMKKTGALTMSNSRYDVYTCTRCDAQKKVCLGVMGR